MSLDLSCPTTALDCESCAAPAAGQFFGRQEAFVLWRYTDGEFMCWHEHIDTTLDLAAVWMGSASTDAHLGTLRAFCVLVGAQKGARRGLFPVK